jgi:peptidoglycan/LPS O-acetylase OafA/YrhL
MLRYRYSMILSSPTFEESSPFLDPEKTSTPPSSTLIAFTLLRKGARLPDRFFRTSKFNISSVLLPSFLHPRGAERSQTSPTAWLDGIRGIAAFLVYIRHFAAATHPDIQYAFDEKHRYIIQLPFFHLLTAGPAMVSLFFIVSGYALSWGPLCTLHYRSIESCFHRLSSAIFRRAIRLFLPGIISTFTVMLCVTAGFYDKGSASMKIPEHMPGFKEPGPPILRLDSSSPFRAQFKDWVTHTWSWLHVWSPINHPYDVHLWTIPVEFRCSMILFIALVAFARTPPRVRLGLLFCCIIYCHYTNFWEGWLFFSGSFLAQLKLLQNQADESLSSLLLPEVGGYVGELKSQSKTSYSDYARHLLFTAGLYLLSAPDYEFGRYWSYEISLSFALILIND